jgi:serine-type D-Ala-D-Ala carboxypeptidase (penicillin-binding protein 5/6)
MRPRVLCWIAIFFFSGTLSAVPLSLNVHADSAILINADTGAVLFEKKAHVLLYPASTTKIATGMYALHVAGDKLDTIIEAEQEALASISEEKLRRSNYSFPSYWLIPGASHIGIKKGEKLSLRDLLYGLLVSSGGDAANVIAQHIGGTIPDFMVAVNAYLKEIGCQNTTFNNPHGLHHPKHQTTAYDLALMMREALKNQTFCEIIATVKYTRPKTEKQESTVLLQTNKLMRKGKFYYPKAIGGKTGYMSASSHTLVVAARDGDRTLIAVLLKSKEREDTFKDAIMMFEAAFNQPKVHKQLFKSGPQSFTLELAGASKPITTYIQDNVNLEFYPAEEPKLKCFLYWTAATPPISKGQAVGELRLQTPEGKVERTIPLLASEEVPATWMWSLKHLFG